MTNLKLFSDSTCDLSKEELEQMDIGIIPLIINFKEKSYRDMTEINSQKLFELVEETDEIPSTSAPSPSVFAEAFSEYTEKGIPVLSINLASCFSSTYSNAHMGGQSCKGAPVTVIDSNMTCGLLGGILRICHEMKLNDRPCEEIIAKARELTENYRLYFTINDLTFLKKGGRIDSFTHFAGSLLGIKPIIEMTKEGLKIVKKARGNPKAIESLIEFAKSDKDRIWGNTLHVACVGSTREQLEELRSALRKATGIDKIYEYTVGCTLACHSGDGVFGLGYFTK